MRPLEVEAQRETQRNYIKKVYKVEMGTDVMTDEQHPPAAAEGETEPRSHTVMSCAVPRSHSGLAMGMWWGVPGLGSEGKQKCFPPSLSKAVVFNLFHLRAHIN